MFICAAALATASVLVSGCGSTVGGTAAQVPAAGPGGGAAPADPAQRGTARASRAEANPRGAGPAEVSAAQYRVLTGQCRYADTERLREECRSAVERDYRVGKANPSLDCRAYSGISLCGALPLSERERRCADDAAAAGLDPRRAEAECYVSP
ncbi:hypothetical protein Pve01_17180 [Planomonospora venezuelensis]|nr:hypothetical protein Pve01_17180 [Planomonospora venezuelensis]